MVSATNRDVYVSGVAETPLGKVPDQTELSMVSGAAREALAEAGLTLRDVDAIFVNYMGEEGSVRVGEYLGIQPRYADSSDLGGEGVHVLAELPRVPGKVCVALGVGQRAGVRGLAHIVA